MNDQGGQGKSWLGKCMQKFSVKWWKCSILFLSGGYSGEPNAKIIKAKQLICVFDYTIITP